MAQSLLALFRFSFDRTGQFEWQPQCGGGIMIMNNIEPAIILLLAVSKARLGTTNVPLEEMISWLPDAVSQIQMAALTAQVTWLGTWVFGGFSVGLQWRDRVPPDGLHCVHCLWRTCRWSTLTLHICTHKITYCDNCPALIIITVILRPQIVLPTTGLGLTA